MRTSPSRSVDPIKAALLASAGEFGWGGWASTFFACDPKEQIALLSFAQLCPSDRYPIRRAPSEALRSRRSMTRAR